MAETTDAKTNPHITVEDYEGKVQSGKYISHDKAGGRRGTLCNVVFEKPNGVRFRFVAVTDDIDDALEVARR